MSNHSSYLDIVQMFNLVPDYFLMMGKYELQRWPLFRIFFKRMDIAVNRGSRVEAAKAFDGPLRLSIAAPVWSSFQRVPFH
ncbi:MAG: 1-acyl-sn-glycerol-3-phosphate acyltransferase [Flavobacteriales bacterium]|nr:1-acyl-sn-glycerol-3-phosphate acyltransferase [Flavobacteriales bacterium]